MRIPSLALFAAVCALSAHAASITYLVDLSGPLEAPPNASPGTGTASIVYDDTAHTLSLSTVFSGLLANTTASHIHCCTAVAGVGTAGVATQTPSFVGFPLGVTSGTYSNVFDLTQAASWNPAFITANGGTTAGAEAAFASGLSSGSAYLNIHTSLFPGGEIRGFLTEVPEPSTGLLFGLSLAGWAWVRRHRSLGRNS